MLQHEQPLFPILLVDDEVLWLRTAAMILGSVGLDNVIQCKDSGEALRLVREQQLSAVMLDLTMPGLSGEELLETLCKEAPGLPIIVVTGADKIDTAVRCMQLGAFDYFVKSSETDRLISSVRRALTVQELAQENRRLCERLMSGDLQQPSAFEHIVTRNPKMRSIFQYVEAIAPSPRPVLITGESGVGKELIAGALHRLSGRQGQYVALNTAGLDDQLCADTLFGHVSGAYTGAEGNRPGLVERARGGTLFLDEIGDMSPLSQAKLLRLLQENEYTPLGSDIPRRSETRVIAATNQNLRELQDAGKFRRDLFFRLSTHTIAIPALRERKEDIPLLVEHFVDQAAAALGKPTPGVPPQLYGLLSAYSFPGNVRELEAMVFDAVSQASGRTVSLEPFRAHMRQAVFPGNEQPFEADRQPAVAPAPEQGAWVAFSDPLPTLAQVEDLLVQEALRRATGNQSKAAAMLGVTRQAVNKRLRLQDSRNDLS